MLPPPASTPRRVRVQGGENEQPHVIGRPREGLCGFSDAEARASACVWRAPRGAARAARAKPSRARPRPFPPAQDKLVDPTSVTHLFRITDGIGCVMTGPLPDSLSAVTKARSIAAEFQCVPRARPAPAPPRRRSAGSPRAPLPHHPPPPPHARCRYNYGYPIPVHYLAKKVADENQIYTQAAYKRSLACIMILGWCVVALFAHLPTAPALFHPP